jgi:hypothetical protein
VQAFTYPLVTLFDKKVRYVVPLYQRPYVWNEDEHWAPLWDDIRGATERILTRQQLGERVTASALAPVAPHFLGAIVLDQVSFASGSIEVRHVIDGQQRLTTLQLFLSATSEVLDTEGFEDEADTIRDLTLNKSKANADPDHIFKVWPTNANRDSFRAVMHPDGAPDGWTDDEDNLIEEGHAFFHRAVSQWFDELREENADLVSNAAALQQAVCEYLKLVVIDLEAGDNAQVIFETLNARGTPLLAIDLVKNLVFQRATAEHADLDGLYNQHWKPFDEGYWRQEVRQGRLTRPRAEVFLMHWLTMQRAEEVGALSLFQSYRKLLDDTTEPAVDLVREFARDGKTFQDFDNKPEGSVERRFFDRLADLDTTTLLPLALYLFCQDASVLDAETRRRALAALESWLVRRMLCRLTIKNYNRYSLELLSALREDGNVSQADKTIISALRAADAPTNRWPDDAELRAKLTGAPLYNEVSQARVVMVLRQIELYLRANSPKHEQVGIGGKLTIEHVLPQSWREYWPVDPKGDQQKEDDRAQHVHRLGNLTLVTGSLNPALANREWKAKRPELQKFSLLLLNRQLVDQHAETWDEATIDDRSANFSEIIETLWPGPDSADWGELPVDPDLGVGTD